MPVKNEITPEEFIAIKVLPEFRPIVAEIRKLMREVAPGANEVITYGILGFKGNKMLAVISPTKKGITLAFSQGAAFEDKYELLEGVGNVSKNVRMKNLTEFNEEALRYYIQQALTLDSKG